MSARRQPTRRVPSPRLNPTQVRQLLKLHHALHDRASDAAVRKRLLLEGVCRMIQADRAVCIISRMDERTGARHVLSVTRFEPAAAAPRASRSRISRPDRAIEAPPAMAAEASPRAQDLLEAGEFGPCIDSLVWLSGMQVVAWLAIGRPRGDVRRFTPRDRVLLQVVHEESAWLYADDLAKATRSESPPPLPGRPPRIELMIPRRNGTAVDRPLARRPVHR